MAVDLLAGLCVLLGAALPAGHGRDLRLPVVDGRIGHRAQLAQIVPRRGRDPPRRLHRVQHEPERLPVLPADIDNCVDGLDARGGRSGRDQDEVGESNGVLDPVGDDPFPALADQQLDSF